MVQRDFYMCVCVCVGWDGSAVMYDMCDMLSKRKKRKKKVQGQGRELAGKRLAFIVLTYFPTTTTVLGCITLITCPRRLSLCLNMPFQPPGDESKVCTYCHYTVKPSRYLFPTSNMALYPLTP